MGDASSTQAPTQAPAQAPASKTKTDNQGEDEWLDLYLKIALLWVDKPSFVRALLFPDFKPKSNHPTILHVVGVSVLFMVAVWIYGILFVATSAYDPKPWGFLPGINGSAFAICQLVEIYFIVKYKLWKPPMTVKAIISAIPPPVRDQGDDHAKTLLTRVAYVAGSAFVAFGVWVFLIISAPIADMLAALFVRDSAVALVEKWAANKSANAQAEAVILGVLGTNVQFADNCSGDIVVKPSVLRALKWQDEGIKKEMDVATTDIDVKLTIFDLDRKQPSIIARGGATLVPVSTDLDMALLAKMGVAEGIRYGVGQVKDQVKDQVKAAVEEQVGV